MDEAYRVPRASPDLFNAALLAKPAQGHTNACRKRMEENMKSDPKIRKANQRIDDFLAKVLEKEDRKRAKNGGHRW